MSERSLRQISDSFGQGQFADDVVMALARAAAGRTVDGKDKETIGKAIKFLQRAEDGFKWLDSPTITSDSMQCAVSFETAVRSLGEQISTDRFIADIGTMLQTSQAVLEGQQVESGALQNVRAFFHRILRRR